MAEKEERIVCRVIEKGVNCDYCFSKLGENYYQCSISNNDCSYDVIKKCSIGMTRQEAIERIAKKICAYSWETLNELAQARYMERAEAALNALLKGE